MNAGVHAWDAWDDEAGHLHVCGTHDVDQARLALLDYVAAAGVELSTADLLDIATTNPARWWAVPMELAGGDVEYPSVPAGTAGAVAMVTWPGDVPALLETQHSTEALDV